jgi:hypothetical protein
LVGSVDCGASQPRPGGLVIGRTLERCGAAAERGWGGDDDDDDGEMDLAADGRGVICMVVVC